MTRAREYENEAEELRKRIDTLEDLLNDILMEHFISNELEGRIETALGIKEE
jgi:hypothetical protein